MNSGEIYRDEKSRGIYLALFTDPEGPSCFSIYENQLDKNERSNFWYLVETLFTIYENFRDFVKGIFPILLQIQLEDNFLPTRKHQQAKASHFFSICLYDCFIYRLDPVQTPNVS